MPCVNSTRCFREQQRRQLAADAYLRRATVSIRPDAGNTAVSATKLARHLLGDHADEPSLSVSVSVSVSQRCATTVPPLVRAGCSRGPTAPFQLSTLFMSWCRPSTPTAARISGNVAAREYRRHNILRVFPGLFSMSSDVNGRHSNDLKEASRPVVGDTLYVTTPG